MSGPSRRLCGLLACAAAFAAAHPASSQADPVLDDSFGVAGAAFWSLDAISSAPRTFHDSASGRLVTAQGGGYYDTKTSAWRSRMTFTAIARDGLRDPAFGSDGQMSSDLPGAWTYFIAGMDSSGSVVVLATDGTDLRRITARADGTLLDLRIDGVQEGVDVRGAAVRPDGSLAVLVGLQSTDVQVRIYPATGSRADHTVVAGAGEEQIYPLQIHPGPDGGLLVLVSVWSPADEGAWQYRVYDLDASLNDDDYFSSAWIASPATASEPEILARDGARLYWRTYDQQADRYVIARTSGDVTDPAWAPRHAEERAVGVIAGDGIFIVTVAEGAAHLIRLDDQGVEVSKTRLDLGSLPQWMGPRFPDAPIVDGAVAYLSLLIAPEVAPSAVGETTERGYTRLLRLRLAALPEVPDAPVFDAPPASGQGVQLPDTVTQVQVLGGAAVPSVTFTREKAQALPTVKLKRCVSRRKFSIRLRKGSANANTTIAKVKLTVNGRVVPVSRRERERGVVDLKGLPRGRFVVRAELQLSNGAKVLDRRAYRTCVAKKNSKNGKPSPVQVIR